MKVMVFTFSRTTPWWRYLASRLAFATGTVVVGELPEADVDLNPSFHRNLRLEGIERRALDALGEGACLDVIARCRLLRVLDRDLAMRMMGAMWLTIQELLDAEKPDLFLSFVVDRYILDLFQRALASRGVRYVGITIGPLDETFMFMARGEYTPVREPSEAEVDAALATLTHPGYVASYVARSRFGLMQFLRIYGYFIARSLAFEMLRFARRRPYDFRYLWASAGQRVRLRDWGVTRYFRDDWKDILAATPLHRRVFVGLSVNPEAAIEYWVRNSDLIDYDNVLRRIARTFADAGFRVFVKDHPTQFGFRKLELFSSLADYATFVPYDVPGQWLVDQCATTLTWTGTVGLQAALAGRCAVVEANAYYRVDGLFVGMNGVEDLDGLPHRVASFRPAFPLPEARRVLARHLLRSSVPGIYMSFKDFKATDAECVRRAETVAVSLNRYLPMLAGKRAA